MKMDTFWEESLGHRLKVERNLNFSTIANEDDEFGFSRKKAARDPMSHRIIEKRRRDRMNNCLADLSRLVPTNYLKKGRGRIEKTEIIEMAIKHLKHLQAHPCKNPGTCEVAKTTEQNHKHQYKLGFQECMSETIRFLVEIEGFYASDGLCVRLMNHLEKHYEKVSGGMCYTQALGLMHCEESTIMPMDAEQTSGFSAENYPENLVQHTDQVNHSLDVLPCERNCPIEDTIKQEISAVQTVQSNYCEPLEMPENIVASKALSQLSIMLQNNVSTKDTAQNTKARNCSSENSEPTTGTSTEYIMESSLSENAHRIDEVYKFKNNIKHRFNADLQQHTSPTDSHSDQISLEEQTHAELRCAKQSVSANICLSTTLLTSERFPCDNRNNHSFTPPPLVADPSGEVPSPNEVVPHIELSVKILDKNVSDSRAVHSNWDCQGDTGSSCGSNLSPQAVRKPNGSSSGYSTNGEMPPGCRIKIQTPDHHSPAVSPYSRTPDHVPSQSPSPQPAHHTAMGIPIFALHPRGRFYIPLTIDSSLVTPYLSSIEEVSPVLHPISICVNFSLGHCITTDKINSTAVHFYSHSVFADKFHNCHTGDDRHSYYSCSTTQK